MRALVAIVALLLLGLAAWIVVRAIRRARVDVNSNAPWRVEHRASGGVTTVEVVRRSESGRQLDMVTVARIPDGDPEWLDLRAAALEEARQRATELNSANQESP